MGKAGKDYKESTQRIIDCVNCPYQVFGGENMAEDAKRSYHDAVKRGRKEKFMPLLVISDDILAETLEALKEDSYSKEKVIRQQETDIEQELKERYEEIAERCQEMDEEEMREEWYRQTGEDFDDAFEEFGETVSEFSSFYLSSDEGEEETILFEIPVENPWEVIAWVPMGGWNECPGAEEMMEVCRYWHKKYGAVPALVSSDTLEFVLEEPVADGELAMQAAREHFAFCPDRVDQGTETGSVAELAGSISKSTYWFFWWD